jgi:TolB-like protein/Tfp pilus assembly protein PilF
MEVLVCLADHAGDTVPKEQLVQTVWPDTFVSDDGLKRCISELRRVFEDDVREPRTIQTIPKRGYRLLAPVEPVDGSRNSSAVSVQEMAGRPAASKRAWWTGAVAIAASVMISALLVALRGSRSAGASGVPAIHSLAVLPLQNLSADPTQEYFSDGMTDALITDLAQIGSVKVISRTSSMQYKQAEKSLPEIARELDVDGIVEGTVQRSGERVRITAQLIQGPLDRLLWAKTYDGDVHDTFALEHDITEDIARHVQERITPTKATQIAQPKRVGASVLAAFLQGNYYLQSFGKGGGDDEKRKAAEYFQRAIDTDPSFAPAYVGLARAHLWLLWPSNQDGEIAKKAAERAIELDPSLSDAHGTLGDLNRASWKWSAAEEEYRRAITINPNNADAHDGLSGLFLMLGKLDEGYREAQIAQTLDPSSDHLSDALEGQGQFDRAIDMQLMMLKRHPDDGYVHTTLFREYLRKGMYKEASLHLDQTAILFGFPEIAAAARSVRSVAGDRGAIRASLHGWEHLMTKHQVFLPVNFAEVYAALGDKNLAFYWLEQAYSQREIGIASTDLNLERLNMEFLLDPIRSDPRFKDLLRRVGLPERAPS